MKILLGYSWFKNNFCVKTYWENWLERLRKKGVQVDGFCLTLDPPRGASYWPELDNLWKNKYPVLMRKYDELLKKLEGYDVFINYNGINVHPEFLPQIKAFKVYSCSDDPESSHRLSQPVAKYYDCCLISNIAAIDLYKSWGVKHVNFWPLGFRDDDHDPLLTKEDILTGKREIDTILLCERKSHWRGDRINKFMNAFPGTFACGYGWPTYLDEKLKVSTYKNSKIGPNIHNSTGPINFRTYQLPANGVLQICDNKANLGKIFALDKEVIGFDNIEECIDKCRYYLDHDDERRAIAAAGWERAVKDYNELACFKVATDNIKGVMDFECVR